jgi:hypothetical protein
MECKSIPSVGVSQNLVLRNFGVELLPALFLLLVYTQPGYGVWDRFFAIEAVRPVCRQSHTFAAKEFFWFWWFFRQKVGSHVNRNRWNQFEDRSKKTLRGDCSAGATTANASTSGQKGVEMPGFEDHTACSVRA